MKRGKKMLFLIEMNRNTVAAAIATAKYSILSIFVLWKIYVSIGHVICGVACFQCVNWSNNRLSLFPLHTHIYFHAAQRYTESTCTTNATLKSWMFGQFECAKQSMHE